MLSKKDHAAVLFFLFSFDSSPTCFTECRGWCSVSDSFYHDCFKAVWTFEALREHLSGAYSHYHPCRSWWCLSRCFVSSQSL